MNQIKKHLDMVRVLNNSFAQKIAAYIEAHPENDVTTIQHALQLEQSVTSQHLAKLRACHFVESKRVGKRIQYTMSPNYKQTIAKIIAI